MSAPNPANARLWKHAAKSKAAGVLSPKAWPRMATRASPVSGKGLAALPPPVKALLIAVGIIALAHPGSRRWLAERCVDVGGVVVPHGCLFRGGSEGLIRQRFIEENLLDGVIGLPANLFFGVGIPA